MTTRHELEAWLGPALDDLTPEQVDRLAAEDDTISERYPDPDEQALRDAALSAAVQYLLGDTTVADAGRAHRAARAAAALAYAATQQVAAMAVTDNILSEVAAAEAAGIDRMTVRKALGKR